jgi:hypothetical protein
MALYIKTVAAGLPAGSLKIKTVSVEVVGDYVDCDNKNESLESLLKRAIVILPDGTYALQVHYI